LVLLVFRVFRSSGRCGCAGKQGRILCTSSRHNVLASSCWQECPRQQWALHPLVCLMHVACRLAPLQPPRQLGLMTNCSHLTAMTWCCGHCWEPWAPPQWHI
jgi:hypothetical protein